MALEGKVQYLQREHAIKSVPTDCLLVPGSHLYGPIIWARAFHALANALSLAMTKPLMTTNYQPGFRTQSYYGTHEPHLPHPDATRGCQERLSHHDWYEAPARPALAPLPRQGEFGIPQQHTVDRVPVRPYPQVRLAQMQDFQRDGSVTLDMFSDQVDELSGFTNGTNKRPVARLEII